MLQSSRLADVQGPHIPANSLPAHSRAVRTRTLAKLQDELIVRRRRSQHQHQQKTSSMTQHETRRADNTHIVDTLGLPLHDACPRSRESGAGRRAPALTRRPRRLHSGWHVTTYEAHPDMACSMAEVMGRGARDSELGNADLETRSGSRLGHLLPFRFEYHLPSN